ncbi:unnamed protein product [Spirodela intermedia]|uniref:holo-[acyl-carrier-protein] synthase n=1 Tax=Spirodela intermedia TaxID=51605 RepID=A0A7I8JNB9_SPIIN|nr:unnamed protein product [Spirodela intermedia]CAA6671083.1 unnamed protein product [Spirodela intermedia]
MFFRGPMSIQSDIFSRRLLVPRPLAKMPLPSSRETHLWYVLPDEVKSPLLLNQYLELLSPTERDNALRMNGDNLQKGTLLSRTLLRTTLARYTDHKASPRSLEFIINRFGKPEVQWPCDGNWTPPPLHFNVSHTSSLIACAVTADIPIGLDVLEKHRQLKSNILSFARRYFAPSEVEFLSSFTDPETRRREFLKLWTLKEAYVKALGRGFSGAPFRHFAIQFKAGATEESTDPNSDVHPEIALSIEPSGDAQLLTADWQFALFELASSHHAAICVKKSGEMNDATTGEDPLRLKVWKVVPSVSEEFVSGTDQVLTINGILNSQG